jgi:hypothetical protein
MSEIKSYVGELEIIHSIEAHVAIKNVLKIILTPFTIEMRFLLDSTLLIPKIDWVVENSLLKITYTTAKNPVGTGILEPWRIGSYQGKELYLTFIARVFDDNSTESYIICNYILYQGKEVQTNG